MSDTLRDEDLRELMRQLHGELPPERARALDRRLRSEPALAAARRRLEAAWGALDQMPQPAPPPPGFAARVTARLRASGTPAGWSAAPAWARATGAAAALAGLALGVGLGILQQPAVSGSAAEGTVAGVATVTWSESADALSTAEGGLAEGYWSALGMLEDEATEEPGT